MAYKLKDEDYLNLYQYFQRKADDVKEAMFKTITWIVGFETALVGFIALKLTDFDASKASVPLSALVLVSAAAGLVICLYAWFLLSESGKHISNNWTYADRCKEHVPELNSIIQANVGKKTMPVWRQLGLINGLYAIAFTLMLCWEWSNR